MRGIRTPVMLGGEECAFVPGPEHLIREITLGMLLLVVFVRRCQDVKPYIKLCYRRAARNFGGGGGVFDYVSSPGTSLTARSEAPTAKATHLRNQSIADPSLALTSLYTLLAFGAKATSALAFSAVIVDKMLGTNLFSFAQGVGTMAISIAADACANVISQNHKLTPKGVLNYALAIGLSHAIYPLVGFGAAATLSVLIQGASKLVGDAGIPAAIATGLAQGAVATTIYGVGSLILFRFLSSNMIPDFRGEEDDELSSADSASPKKGILRQIDRAYGKFMDYLEKKILDTSRGEKINLFNDLETSIKSPFQSIKNILGTLRHPEVVKCSIDSFVSTFAKMAFVGATTLTVAGQVAAIGLTSVLVFGFVLGAGYASLKAFSKLKAISQAHTSSQGLTDRGSPRLDKLKAHVENFFSDHAIKINQVVNTLFKATGVGTLGYFASNSAAACIKTFAQIFHLPTNELLLTAAFLGLFLYSSVGLDGLRDFWRASGEEAKETVDGVKGGASAT